MTRDMAKLVDLMTVEEKAGLCSGADFWHTKPVERLNIPAIMMADGPHGVRKEIDSDEPAMTKSTVPATCFPSAAGLACSWDRSVLESVGVALGQESRAEGIAILLGPAVNIKRSPLCGRNFEYLSEDPFLASQLAVSYIRGVQSQGVGTSIKHFAANNQEYRRMSTNAVIDERTLREIYLAAFETAIVDAKPWSVMCSYNQVNGDFASENSWLLTHVLREDWHFDGFVMSDWGAVNERDKGLAAGLDLEMPSSGDIGDGKIARAVRSGQIPEAVLDQSAKRIVRAVARATEADPFTPDSQMAQKHHELARHIAAESMVLLKNAHNVLPLKRAGRVAVIGQMAHNPRYQGGGSSHVNPTQVDDIYNSLQMAGGPEITLSYADGYRLDESFPDENLIDEAQRLARQSDVVLVFAGLPESYESEGYDRRDMRLPENQDILIHAVSSVNTHVVVVLSNGSPVEMPWIDRIDGLLECYLGGQALGGAVADLLYGDINPSGKLAETFPVKLEHNPSYLNFPGEGNEVHYAEGIFVGYRYYDKKAIAPQFPFGFGLSYTTFAYSGLECDADTIKEGETVHVSVTVKNTGNRAGKEVVQLYVRAFQSRLIRAAKELKGFEKVFLEPGEEAVVRFALNSRAFAYYDVGIADWCVETNSYALSVGPSSADMVLSAPVHVESARPYTVRYTRNSTIGELMKDPRPEALAVTAEIQNHFEWNMSAADDSSSNWAEFFPLRALLPFSQGAFTEDTLADWLTRLNAQ